MRIFSTSHLYPSQRAVPISLVVLGMVTIASIAALCASDTSCLLNAHVASFQLVNPLETKHASMFPVFTFFSLIAFVQVKRMPHRLIHYNGAMTIFQTNRAENIDL